MQGGNLGLPDISIQLVTVANRLSTLKQLFIKLMFIIVIFISFYKFSPFDCDWYVNIGSIVDDSAHLLRWII